MPDWTAILKAFIIFPNLENQPPTVKKIATTRRGFVNCAALDCRAVFSARRDDGTELSEGFSPKTLAARMKSA
jgi:hypothetical protein